MIAVGIDVSKGKSMVAIMRPLGEMVKPPFEVAHTATEISGLVKSLKELSGETKIIVEYTSAYYIPIAYALYKEGFYVCVIQGKLIHDYSNDSIRRIKTDPKDAIKIANYGLDKWLKIRKWVPESDLRKHLKVYSRQYTKYSQMRGMLVNNFHTLVDQTFHNVSELFTSTPRKSDGHQKWLDFAMEYWHCECVCGKTTAEFSDHYRNWCKKNRYNYSISKANDTYAAACASVSVLPMDEASKFLVRHAVTQLNAVSESRSAFSNEMKSMAEQLPEYPVVMEFYGVADVIGPQLMAEIGDVTRFEKKGSLVCFAGLESSPFQSGKFEAKSRSVSKKGSPFLRRTLFLLMDVILKSGRKDDPIFQFLDRKRAENKHYYVYMTAGCAKFLRMYYARVRAHLTQLEVVGQE